MPNIPGIENIQLGGVASQIMYWVGYGLMIVLVFAFLMGVYYFMSYKYKVTIMQRRGMGMSSDNGEHSVGRIKRDRARIVRGKGGTERWRLLFGRKYFQPPEFDAMYPGNNIFLYQTGGHAFSPVKFKCDNPSADFTPLPQHIRRWEQLDIQQATEDYKKQSAWDKYGTVVITMGAILFCLILVGFTVYYTYQHANGVTSSLSGLTDALKSGTVIPGMG